MKKFLLLSLIFVLILAACERPAREVPETVTDDETPATTIEEAKPEDLAPSDGALTTDGGQAGGEATTDEGDGTAAGGTDAGGEAATDGGEATGEEAAGEGDTTTQPATEAELPQNVTYQIKAGDTLFAIGLLYGVSVDDIVAANNLTNADSLEVGQLIIIPVGGLPETSEQPTTDGETPSSGEQVHIVSAGQTLFGIGQIYGFTVDELVAYNNLADPNDLEIGQEIKIPPQ